MEQDRREAAEVAVEVVLVRAGWEVTARVPDRVGNVSAQVVGRASRIKWVTLAITGAVPNAEQKW